MMVHGTGSSHGVSAADSFPVSSRSIGSTQLSSAAPGRAPTDYVTELSRLKHGRPLYNPEDEVNIGDVGFFEPTSGEFRLLFNVFLAADHQFHVRHGVPNEFVPLPPSVVGFTTRSNYFPPQVITSRSVKSIGFGFRDEVPS
jgi:hypothetical protein